MHRHIPPIHIHIRWHFLVVVQNAGCALSVSVTLFVIDVVAQLQQGASTPLGQHESFRCHGTHVHILAPDKHVTAANLFAGSRRWNFQR